MNLNAQVVRAGRISPGIWAHGLCEVYSLIMLYKSNENVHLGTASLLLYYGII